MEETRHTFGNGLILSEMLTVILTVIFFFGMPYLLKLMNTPADIYENALTYIRIISIGIAAQMLYGFMAETLRAIGNSKVPLYLKVFYF